MSLILASTRNDHIVDAFAEIMLTLLLCAVQFQLGVNSAIFHIAALNCIMVSSLPLCLKFFVRCG